MLTLSPFSLAVCGHHLSPSIAIVFSLLSNMPNFSLLHPSIFHTSSSNTMRSFLHSSHSLTVWVLLMSALATRKTCAPTSPFTRLGIHISSYLADPGPPYTKTQFQRFRAFHWAMQKYVLIIISYFNYPYISVFVSVSPFFLAL